MYLKLIISSIWNGGKLFFKEVSCWLFKLICNHLFPIFSDRFQMENFIHTNIWSEDLIVLFLVSCSIFLMSFYSKSLKMLSFLAIFIVIYYTDDQKKLNQRLCSLLWMEEGGRGPIGLIYWFTIPILKVL